MSEYFPDGAPAEQGQATLEDARKPSVEVLVQAANEVTYTFLFGYMELLRRGYVVTVGRAGEKEIDFVCEKRGEKLYVQVTYLLASEDTVKREFGAYDGIQDNFPKYVVSLDEFDMSRNGIKHRNIRDFLLAEEWN